MDQAAHSFSIKPLSAHTGAEIRGVDLSQPLDDATRDGLNRAFVDHAVLCIRDQKLSAPQFLEAMKVFGEIFPQHNSRFAVPECPAIHYISNQDKWRTAGSTFRARATTPTIRTTSAAEGDRAARGEAAGRPAATRSSSTCTRPMTRLPEATRKRIDGLQAKHVYQSKYSERKLPRLLGEKKKIETGAVLHPLVRTHPRSGRKAIYINPIRIEEIVGLAEAEALPLLDELLEHATQEKFQYRHKWHSGDMVMWDNRCLLHKANGDYPVAEVRYLYRLMLKGERPV